MGPPGGVRQVAFLFLVKTVFAPVFGIVDNVTGDVVVGCFGANDVLPVVALPEFSIESFPSKFFNPTNVFIGGHRFEPIHCVPNCGIEFLVLYAVLGVGMFVGVGLHVFIRGGAPTVRGGAPT